MLTKGALNLHWYCQQLFCGTHKLSKIDLRVGLRSIELRIRLMSHIILPYKLSKLQEMANNSIFHLHYFQWIFENEIYRERTLKLQNLNKLSQISSKSIPRKFLKRC